MLSMLNNYLDTIEKHNKGKDIGGKGDIKTKVKNIKHKGVNTTGKKIFSGKTEKNRRARAVFIFMKHV